MHILIDASCLMKNLTGVGVYANHLLQTIIPLDPGIRYTLFMNAFKGPMPEFGFSRYSNVRIVRRRVPGKLVLELWRHGLPPSIEWLSSAKNVDLFHSPNFLYQTTHISNIITTVHDIAFLKNPRYGSRYSGAYHREILPKRINRSKLIVVCSNAVKTDLIHFCHIPENKIRVIHHGLNPDFRPGQDIKSVSSALSTYGISSDYILSVGTLEPRKNFPLLIQSFAELSRKYDRLQLVIAGKPADASDVIRDHIQKQRIGDRVIVLGYVPHDILIRLYQCAQMAVFPALEEGFGFGPLEAAACGIPVIASDIPAHREVMADAAVYFMLDDPGTLTSAIDHLLLDSEKRQQQIHRASSRVITFSWQQNAIQHLQVYKEAATR